MVFLMTSAKFFCCRAQVFIFLENLKCTGALIFMHHLCFLQWKYKMWASWQQSCNLYSNKKINRPWWNMLLYIGWRITVFRSPNKKGTLKCWCWAKIMYDHINFYIWWLIPDTCFIWTVHKQKLFNAYSIFGNDILLSEKFNTPCLHGLYCVIYCEGIRGAVL